MTYGGSDGINTIDTIDSFKIMDGFPAGQRLVGAHLALANGISPTVTETDIINRYNSVVAPTRRPSGALTQHAMEDLVAKILNGTLASSHLVTVIALPWNRPSGNRVLQGLSMMGKVGSDYVQGFGGTASTVTCRDIGQVSADSLATGGTSILGG